MDYALDGTNLLQMIFIGLFRLAQHYQHLQARLLVKGDQVRFSYHVLFLKVIRSIQINGKRQLSKWDM